MAGVLGIVLAVSMPAYPFRIGVGVGYDPSALWVISALTETSIGEVFLVRAQVGLATGETEGLMLLGGSLLAHTLVPPIDPYAGLGIGLALTPAGFSDGLTAEAVVGARVAVADPAGLFAQARFIARFIDTGIDYGPLFEAGIHLLF